MAHFVPLRWVSQNPVHLSVVNEASHVGEIKINSVSAASVVLFGDTRVVITDASSVTTPLQFVGTLLPTNGGPPSPQTTAGQPTAARTNTPPTG